MVNRTRLAVPTGESGGQTAGELSRAAVIRDINEFVSRPRFQTFNILTGEAQSCNIGGLPGGAVAQLGERLNGIQEVASSILVSSTTEITPFPLR